MANGLPPAFPGIDGPLLIPFRRFPDARGDFRVLWQDQWERDAGVGPFVQDNIASSRKGVLRGLHFQDPGAQGKLVTALAGALFDVVVDCRSNSPTLGAWAGRRLAPEDALFIWVPPGFAHGYQALVDDTILYYKVDAPYRPDDEVCLRWDDAEVGIDWPIQDPLLSPRDADGLAFRDCPRFEERAG